MNITFFQSINELNQQLAALISKYSTVFVLTDSNTKLHCLPLLSVDKFSAITIPAGEKNKNLLSLTAIWETLTIAKADRKAVLVNLGGGMVTDIGGFAAATYKRGIDFINIPTSLLAQVDAAVGAKTGIDFLQYKNQLGVFADANNTLICTDFLATLPEREYTSGIAEIIKHYLIADAAAFYDFQQNISLATIQKAITIKSTFVNQDPFENNIRKALNFGHTIGHAIESYYLESETPLLHGEAIAIGMIVESHLSYQIGNLTEAELTTITTLIMRIFPYFSINKIDEENIISLCYQDKKNKDGVLFFSLLKNIGNNSINEAISTEQIINGLDYYRQYAQ